MTTTSTHLDHLAKLCEGATPGGLLTCPFCGGRPEVEREGNHRHSHVVVCEDCGVRMESNEVGHTCGMQWNRRALSPTVVRALVEVAKAAANISAALQSTEAVYDADRKHGGRGISDEVKEAAGRKAVSADAALERALAALEAAMKGEG